MFKFVFVMNHYLRSLELTVWNCSLVHQGWDFDLGWRDLRHKTCRMKWRIRANDSLIAAHGMTSFLLGSEWLTEYKLERNWSFKAFQRKSSMRSCKISHSLSQNEPWQGDHDPEAAIWVSKCTGDIDLSFNYFIMQVERLLVKVSWYNELYHLQICCC